MSKSDLTINPTGTTRGRMTGRTLLLAILAVIVGMAGFAAMASDANANVGLGADSGNRDGNLADPVNFGGSGAQYYLPRQVTIYLYNDHNNLFSPQSSSNAFTITGSAYRRNGGSCNGTATGTSWTSTITGSNFGGGNSCSIVLELIAGTAPGTHRPSSVRST